MQDARLQTIAEAVVQRQGRYQHNTLLTRDPNLCYSIKRLRKEEVIRCTVQVAVHRSWWEHPLQVPYNRFSRLME